MFSEVYFIIEMVCFVKFVSDIKIFCILVCYIEFLLYFVL